MARVLGASDRIAVVGLGFGDEGKGSTVDALARRLRASTVVRFNGGPQAAHHVVTPDGRVHCFSQLGSALLAAPDVQSFSTHRVLVEPLGLLREAEALQRLGVDAPLARLHLHERSVVVTPFHRVMNRALEVARGGGRHGSCGLGVGQAYTDALNPSVPTVRLGELRDPATLRRKLELIRWMKLDLAEQLQATHAAADLAPLLSELRRRDLTDATLERYTALLHRVVLHSEGYPGENSGVTLLEGAQGVLLDEHHGFWPHVTPSTTTFAWAEEACREPPYRLGLLRAFSTRHGAGPFVAERRDDGLLRGEHNALNDWQGSFRVGCFDEVMARHALAVVGGVDGLAISCLDRLPERGPVGWIHAWQFQGDPGTVSDLFEMTGSRILGIRASADPSRTRQERLARAMADCTPITEELDSVEALLERIEATLQTPVVLQSWGPTALDKQG